MKVTLYLSICLCLFTIGSLAQTPQTFDIATFQPPKGWTKQAGQDAMQFSTEENGSFALITLYRSVASPRTAKENFDMAWTTIVKEAVPVKAAPQMLPAETKDGWAITAGLAAFEKDGAKGVAILVNASGFGKMVNIVLLTNTDAYESVTNAFLDSITLKKPAVDNTPPVVVPPTSQAIQTQPARKSNFKFSTTNFDDGWNATEQEDWVEVAKGQIKVLIHYPKQGTIFPADPEPLTNAAWDILVAPRYSNLKNYKTAYINTYNRPYLGMGYATERASGKQVFLLLFRQGSTGWLEFVAPDKNAFIQQYKFDPEAIRWDSESDLMNPLVQMVNYNKFAVAESDFTGTWTSDFNGVQQLYNVYTGNYAGMHMNQSREEFVFGVGGSYNWRLLVVSGMVGSANYANVKSAGKFTVLNNWQVNFSRIETGPKTYNAHWSCIKGARLLHLIDAKNPGSGIATVFGKK